MIEKIKKHFIKILIGAGIIGVALAIGGGEVIPTVPSVDVNGTVIEFPYTNDNIGENLIIRSDKESYKRFLGGAIVYFSIENKSGENQQTDVRLYFSQDNRFLGNLYKLDQDVETICSSYSSTTDSWTEESCIKDEWTELPLLGIITEKEEFKANKTAQLSIPKDKTAYFKAEVLYPSKITDEFFIEAIGNNGGYGFLDPTILPDPQDFNTLTTGNLDDQDGWTKSDGNVGDMQIQESVVYEGAKAISTLGVNCNYYKDGTNRADGKITVYWRKSNITSSTYFTLYEGATGEIVYSAGDNDGYVSNHNGTTWENVGTFSANTWFSLEIEWRSSDYKNRARVNGGTWSDWLVSYGGSWTALNRVRLSGAPGVDNYYDYISENPYSENSNSNSNNAIFFGTEF